MNTLQNKQSDYALSGLLPESWHCVDCGFDTAPGFFNRREMENAFAASSGDDEGIEQCVDSHSEVYTVRNAIWKKAGMSPMGGCLCIGCLEKRLGRKLKRRDFPRKHPFNHPLLPGTSRLLRRRS